MKHSKCCFFNCVVKNAKYVFCDSYNSEVNFLETIFENVPYVLKGEKLHSNIYDCKFENCKEAIICVNKFRMIVRNSSFINCSKNSINTYSEDTKNHVEIGDCDFKMSLCPYLVFTNKNNYIDAYCNNFF